MARRASRVGMTGPLEAYAEEFTAVLAGWGYTPLSAANQVRVMAHASRWLEGRGLGVEQFTAELIEHFLLDRRTEGYTPLRTRRGMQPLLRFLRDRGVVPVESAPAARASSPREVLLEEYRCYLAQERALAKSTIQQRLSVGRAFLDWLCSEDGSLRLEELSAAQVTGFVTVQCRDHSVGWAKT